MAGDINKRLQQLRARRDGSVRLTTDSLAPTVLLKSVPQEAWESRGKTDQPYTRYALGSMQAVSADYTRVSIETADRVANQLAKANLNVEFRLQGSVPLDVHIRGVSDVDLLAVENVFLTYYTAGAKAKRGFYTSPSNRTSVEVLTALRTKIEPALKGAFPAATVDTSGSKAVKISGGSLLRDVDVVPSHWLDTVLYQDTDRETHRGVTILDKKKSIAIENHPFLHIELVRKRCDETYGGLRKSIRLCKNVKADSDRNITLPSFDIAAVMYHANLSALRMGSFYELSILAETQRHLDALACDHELAKTLYVPDGSRRIFDSNEKLQGLNELSKEMDDLLKAVYSEHKQSYLLEERLSYMRDAVKVLAV
uniref:hypothetical protein n=1 Tax=Hylemonella sp. TaxID=2066020 RepID=UPI0035ADEF11